jgi:hypothetical protein
MRTLSLLVFLAGGVWSQARLPPKGQPIAVKKGAEGARGERETGQTKHSSNYKSAPAQNQIVSAPEKSTAERKGAEELEINRQLADYTGQLAAFTKLLVFVGIFQFLALIAQAIIFRKTLIENRRLIQASRDAANAARMSAEGLIKSERAWLVVNSERPAKLIDAPGNAQIKALSFEIANRGRTPARFAGNIRANSKLTRLEELPANPDFSPAYLEPAHLGSVLSPNETMAITVPIPTENWTAVSVGSGRKGDRQLFVYASVLYYSFGETETAELGVCYIYAPEQPWGKENGFIRGGPKEHNKHT